MARGLVYWASTVIRPDESATTGPFGAVSFGVSAACFKAELLS